MNITKEQFFTTAANQKVVEGIGAIAQFLFPQHQITIPQELQSYINGIRNSIEKLEAAEFSPEQIMNILTGATYNDSRSIIGAHIEHYINQHWDANEVVQSMKMQDVHLNTIVDYVIRIKTLFGDTSRIDSSGSDPHIGGRHTLFVTFPGMRKKVYKEHSLNVDNAFVGEVGIIAYCNTLIPDINLKLPTMQIDPINNMEEFVVKKRLFNSAEAKLYFFKFGMLECISQVIGATDLHHDNIMPTINGPLVIDAECAFLHFNPDTLIENTALCNDKTHQDNDESLSFFLIDDIPAVQAYKDPINQYKLDFKKGYNYMREILQQEHKAHPERMSCNITTIVSKIDKIRILPWSTPDLACLLDAFYIRDTTITNEEAYLDRLLNPMKSDLYKYLERTNLSYSINDAKINSTLKSSLFAATLPALEICVTPQKPANILLDGELVGTIVIDHKMIAGATINKLSLLTQKSTN